MKGLNVNAAGFWGLKQMCCVQGTLRRQIVTEALQMVTEIWTYTFCL